MNVLRNPEYRGIVILVLVIAVMGFVLAVATGKLELFPGPMALDKIIFVSDATGSPEICAMNADGSGRTQLTTGAKVRSAPAISARGNRIVYVGRFERSDQVFAIGAEGGMPDRLTSATGPKKEPRYTPDGKQLSFIASGRVFVAETNGDSPRPIFPTASEVRAAMSNPLRRGEVPPYFDYGWAPDSEAIVGLRKDPDGNDAATFLAGHDAEPKSPPLTPLLNELLKQEGASKRRIAPDERVRITGLAWAAKAPALAFSAVSRNDGFLIVFGVEKGELRLGGFRSFGDHKIGQPAFAPDGSAVVIPMSSTDGISKAGLLKLDLANGRAEVIASGVFERPSYSPAGDRILATLSNEIRQRRDVVTIELATGKVERLTRDGGSHDAIWSPASEK